MGKHDNGEDGSQVEVIMPDGFGSSFSTQQIRAKVFREFLVSHGTNPFFSDIGYLAPVIWDNLCITNRSKFGVKPKILLIKSNFWVRLSPQGKRVFDNSYSPDQTTNSGIKNFCNKSTNKINKL